MTEYCDVADCDRPTAGHGRGKCSTHLKQLQRTGTTTTIAEKLTPKQRYLEEVLKLADWDPDDDEGYDRQERKVITLGKQLGGSDLSDRIRAGMQAAQARGSKPGRPSKADLHEITSIYFAVGSVTATAKILGLSKQAVSERLRAVRKGSVSGRTDLSTARLMMRSHG